MPFNVELNVTSFTQSSATLSIHIIPESQNNVFEINIASSGGGFTLPFASTDIQSVDWGDSTTNTSLTHTYSTPGTYTVSVQLVGNTATAFSFYNSPHKSALVRIAALPADLSAITSFEHCFDGHTNLLSIPSNSFSTAVNATTFSYCFFECQKLNFDNNGIIPNLFDTNTLSTDFSYLFRNNYAIKQVSSTLFDAATQATNFSRVFAGSGLIEIPTGFMALNTLVSDLYGAFYTCGSLVSIPSDFLQTNTAITSVNRLFYQCFNIATSVPPLWTWYPDIADHDRCFYQCSKATNFNSIPIDWK